MEWRHPEYLYLILPLCAAWTVLSLHSRRCRRRAADAFVAAAMSARVLPVESRFRFWIKLLLRDAALVAGLAAMAGPRFGTQHEEVIPRGSDLYVLVDVSRSMLAGDVPPSRLGRAKADVAALVNRLEGERIGLIAFAGQAVVKCPLTVDYDAFRRSLDELDPDSAPRGGTAIGDAIRKALEVFHDHGKRDQAILLITDGDDQQSYPREAAAVAAERHVTIFTVGLGDADRGARIPQKTDSKSYVEYQGQQVWSKLHGSLLQDLAIKTSGVYVPVGTRAYDLGELYANYLHGRRGADGAAQKRIRRSEQFQIFLALAFCMLLIDLGVRPYRAPAPVQDAGLNQRAPSAIAGAAPADGDVAPGAVSKSDAKGDDGYATRRAARTAVIACVLAGCLSALARAGEPAAEVREGLRLYAEDKFGEAGEKFAAARTDLDQQRSENDRPAAIAAFDEACAWHRKGDLDRAREQYLKAGLAHDKPVAAAAHFNLGTLSAEQARTLAGEQPEMVAVEKRQEILDHLKRAVAAFRHSLELQPDNSRARRDIELVRSWIKYYTGKWQERDRRKRREESNLIEFLEYLMQTQTVLREAVKAFPPAAPADLFAESARSQSELQQEIGPLREKIQADLQPQQPGAASPQPAAGELEQGIALLQGWADAAGTKMTSAANRLKARQAAAAIEDQQSAIDELEKIWEALIPFQPLLARDLADQTGIARSLAPASAEVAPPDDPDATATAKTGKAQATEPKSGDARKPHDSDGPAGAASQQPVAGGTDPGLGLDDRELAQLAELQTKTLRRTQLLKLKAEAELQRLENSPPPGTSQAPGRPDAQPAPPQTSPDKDAGTPPAPPAAVDPEQAKAGYRKAIERAPEAVEQMQAAVKALKQQDRQAAYPPAEAARKILEEIQQAQPRQEQPQDQEKDQKDQKEDQDRQNQNQDQQPDKSPQPDEKKNDRQKQENRDQKQQDQQHEPDKKQQQVSRDRIEEALRKVRERQQEKRERDQQLKARVLGRIPVEKDW